MSDATDCLPPGSLIELGCYSDIPKMIPIPDLVNNPSHYQGNCLEVIDIIEDFNLNFCLGNAVKYILRAGKKDSSKQDLMKAIWYLQRELEE